MCKFITDKTEISSEISSDDFDQEYCDGEISDEGN